MFFRQLIIVGLVLVASAGLANAKVAPEYLQTNISNNFPQLQLEDESSRAMCPFTGVSHSHQSYSNRGYSNRSDVTHLDVMHKASAAMAEGSDFILIGATYTMLKSKKPVVAVCAVRTGCGKSQTSRKVVEYLMAKGLKVVAIRRD